MRGPAPRPQSRRGPPTGAPRWMGSRPAYERSREVISSFCIGMNRRMTRAAAELLGSGYQVVNADPCLRWSARGHSVPEGVFVASGDGQTARFILQDPPDDDDVERIVSCIEQRLTRVLDRWRATRNEDGDACAEVPPATSSYRLSRGGGFDMTAVTTSRWTTRVAPARAARAARRQSSPSRAGGRHRLPPRRHAAMRSPRR